MRSIYEDHCETIQDKWLAKNTLAIMVNHMQPEQIPKCIICLETLKGGRFVDTACQSCKKACVHMKCMIGCLNACPCCRQKFAS